MFEVQNISLLMKEIKTYYQEWNDFVPSVSKKQTKNMRFEYIKEKKSLILSFILTNIFSLSLPIGDN